MRHTNGLNAGNFVFLPFGIPSRSFTGDRPPGSRLDAGINLDTETCSYSTTVVNEYISELGCEVAIIAPYGYPETQWSISTKTTVTASEGESEFYCMLDRQKFLFSDVNRP